MSSFSTAGRTVCRLFWIDVLWIAAVSLAMAGLYLVPPHRRSSRLFPLWRGPDGRIVGPRDISYPHVEEILTSLYAAIACLLVPIAVVVVVQIWLKSIWDFSAGVLGLLKTLVAAFVSLPIPILPAALRYPLPCTPKDRSIACFSILRSPPSSSVSVDDQSTHAG